MNAFPPLNKNYKLVVCLCIFLGCASWKNYSYKFKADSTIEAGKIELYPTRLSEIVYGEPLLDIEKLLDPEFIYNYITTSQQATSNSIATRQLGASIEANDFLVQSITQTLENVLSSSVSEELKNELSTVITSALTLVDSTSTSSIDTDVNASNLAGSQSQNSSSTTENATTTSGFNTSPESVLNRLSINQPSRTAGLNLSYREVLYEVANAQLGGRGLTRRLNLENLASETHKLFVLPVDIHFNPGTITGTNYYGKANFSFNVPDSLNVHILAATPVGYSQIVSDFSSTIRDLYMSAAGGLGLSAVLLEGKLESVIQDIATLESIFTSPEFNSVITGPNEIEFYYYGSKELSGASVLKPQTFHAELIVMIEGYKESNNSGRSLSGFELLQKFKQRRFDSGVTRYENLSNSLNYQIIGEYLPTKKLKIKKNKFKRLSEIDYSDQNYQVSIDSGPILTNRLVSEFNKIDVTGASIFEQREENCGDEGYEYCGFLVFKGNGFETHKLIRQYFFGNDSVLYDLTKILRDKANNEIVRVAPEFPSSFVFSVSTIEGEPIIIRREPVIDFTGENFVSIHYKSNRKLKPGDQLNVLLQVRENIREDTDPQETILLYKTVKIDGKAPSTPSQIPKGISSFSHKISILERTKVGIEISLNAKVDNDLEFIINNKSISPLVLENKTMNPGTPNLYVTNKLVLIVDLESEEQNLNEIRNNKYHLLIKSGSEVVFSKFLE